jgi:hypothetical protein
MRMHRVVVLVAVAVVGSGCVSTVAPTTAPEPKESAESPSEIPPPKSKFGDDSHRFYKGVPYGSESQFSPLTEVLNEGFDMFRIDNMNRRLADFPFDRAAKNVFHSLIHADSAYRAYGFRNTLTDELLPLSWGTSGGPQWLANYTCHFLGSGMVSARMVEWFEAHDVPHPVALSVLSMYAAHFMNEVVEDGGADQRTHPLDAVADIYVFDLAGILVFRSERVQKFFGETLELTNWQGQATLTTQDNAIDNARIENTYQEFVLRFPFPRTDKVRGMAAWGPYSMAGVSIGSRYGTSVSLAGGGDIKTHTDAATGKSTNTFKPYGGIFIDRRGSLLASVVVKDSREVLAAANIYPGVIRVGGTTFGLWGQLLNDHTWRVGIVPTFGLGFGKQQRY